jgi:hypothetical protein
MNGARVFAMASWTGRWMRDAKRADNYAQQVQRDLDHIEKRVLVAWRY